MASLLPQPLSVEEILELNVEELRAALIQKGINVRGVAKTQLQSQLIQLTLTVQTEDRVDRLSVHSGRSSTHSNTQVESETVALRRLEIELEVRKLEIATAAETQLKEKELATQLKEKELATQLASDELKCKEKELETQNQFREKELANQLASEELKLKQRELEYKEKVELERLRMQGEQVNVERIQIVGVDKNVESAKKSLPKFNETTEIDTYLTLFERTLETFEIDKSKWSSILQSQVTGKVIKVFVELPVEQAKDYDFVKESILNLFQLVPEAYRVKFRNLNKDPHETFSHYATRLSFPFNKWLSGANASNDLDRVKEVFKVEQFLSKITDQSLKTWLLDKQPECLVDAAKLADHFTATHINYVANNDVFARNRFQPNGNSFRPMFANQPTHKFHSGVENSNNAASWRLNSANTKPNFLNYPNHGKGNNFRRGERNLCSHLSRCGFCHKQNHTIDQCFALKKQREERAKGGQNHGFSDNNVNLVQQITSDLNTVNTHFRPFCTKAVIFN